VEVFGGGAGYGLRHSHLCIDIAEADQNLFGLWAWLVNASADDILSIPCDNATGLDIRTMGLSRGQQLLLKNWQRTNNKSECWTISSWGSLPGQWTRRTRSRVADDAKKISHWNIHSDGFLLMESSLAMDPLITWFVDPPYLHNYKYGFNSFDYDRLVDCVNNLKGQVIACEALCPKTKLAPEYLPFEPFRKSITSRRKDGCNTHSHELIYHKAPIF
jgi:hypothetical protein